MGGGRGLCGGPGKRVDGVFPGRPQSFRHQRRPVDDCSPGRGEWRRTAEQGAGHFMAKWIVGEKAKAGLRQAVVCPNVTGIALASGYLKGTVVRGQPMVFPGRPQSFRHQRRPVDDCSPGRGGMAQNGGTRGGTFHGEMDRWRESQGWTTTCSGMPERDGNCSRIELSQGHGCTRSTDGLVCMYGHHI